MNRAWDVAAGVLSSFLVAFLLLLGARISEARTTALWALAGTTLALGARATYLDWIRPRSIGTRQNFMATSLKALRAETSRHREEEPSRISTTRFSSWEMAELSEERASLRVQNDKAAEIGVRLCRLHNVVVENDRTKLLYELDRYAGHHNASVRAFFDLDWTMLPELVVTTRYAAIGPAATPGRLVSGFACRRQRDVKAVGEYFAALWELACPMMDHGRIVPEARDRLREWSPTAVERTPR